MIESPEEQFHRFTVKTTQVTPGVPGWVKLVGMNPRRVSLIISVSPASTGLISPDKTISDTGGLLLTANYPQQKFQHKLDGPLPSVDWYGAGATTIFTMVETILEKFPRVAEG